MNTLFRTLLLATTLLCCSAHAEITEVSQQQLMDNRAQYVVIDTRTRGEYDSGHIPGALHLSYDAITSNPNLLREHRDRTIVTYCEHGGRALEALQSLEAAGYKNLGHLAGDMSGWRNAGLPAE